MKPFAVYSAMAGAYDAIRQPQVIDPRFDYILFTNDIADASVGVWQIRPIDLSSVPLEIFSADHRAQNVRLCRYIKTHSHTLLPGYEATLWMDSNIQILTPELYDRFFAIHSAAPLIASMEHPSRNCIYDEAYEVMISAIEDEAITLAWGQYLRRCHYPKRQGLFETNVLYRRSCAEISAFNDDWWHYIEHYSKRDQLSFNFVLYQHQLSCASVFRFPEPYEGKIEGALNCRNSSAVSFVSHSHTRGRNSLPSRRPTRLQKYWWRPDHDDLYYLAYGTPSPRLTANLIGLAFDTYYLAKRFFKWSLRTLRHPKSGLTSAYQKIHHKLSKHLKK